MKYQRKYYASITLKASNKIILIYEINRKDIEMMEQLETQRS